MFGRTVSKLALQSNESFHLAADFASPPARV